MTFYRSRQSLAAAALTIAVLAGGAGADIAYAQSEGRVMIKPARSIGEARAGAPLRTVRVTNASFEPFTTRVVPVLLTQSRDGAIVPRTDAASRRTAEGLFRASRDSFDLPARGAVSANARLERMPSPLIEPPEGRLVAMAVLRRLYAATQNVYGGLLFLNTPKRAGGERGKSSITRVLGLTASYFVRPPAGERTLAASLGRISVKQGGPRRLRYLVPVANEGNTDFMATGAVTVRDESGAVVARRPLRKLPVLPGSTVDLSGLGAERLPAGHYELEARVSAAGRRISARGEMKLFGVSEIASTGARLTAFDPGDAYLGEPLELSAGYENTGNVPFQPRAELLVRRGGSRGLGASRRVPLTAERTDPGDKGRVSGKVELPGRGNYTLELRLMEGDRVLSERSSNVTPVAKPSLVDRLTGWLREHVLLLAGAVLIAMFLVMAVMARAFLKLRRAEKI